ncbi:MAG: hypothetical protein KatS3mg068_1005 [Candidatus Sericytochromatia bacterium]|nr:MAG: hypothetical protein KatS3mg068_1005 [Candidatus Sericytochromatia bacterium]
MNNKNEENKNPLQRAKKLSVKKDDEIVEETELFKFEIKSKEEDDKLDSNSSNQEEIKILDLIDDEKHQQNVSKKDVNKNNKEINLKDIKNNLNQEVKTLLSNISSSIPKETVNKLLKDIENNKEIIFDKKIVNIFPSLNQNEVDLINKKMEEWNIPKEAQELNAEVIIAWLKNSKKNV